DYNGLSTDFGDPASAVDAAFGYLCRKSSDVIVNGAASTDSKYVFGDGDWATTAEKMYFPTEPGVAIPAWRVLIWEPVNAYYVMVDAADGMLLWRKNITDDQTESATFNVYIANNLMQTADSPAPFSPGPVSPLTGTQGSMISRSSVTLIGNEGDNSFNDNGWMINGANITDGNATEAGIDRVPPEGVDSTQSGTPTRVFNSTWNPPPGDPAPGDSPLSVNAQRGAVVQMFYIMNRYHDELYKLGFTEPAFNFQHLNFGRGGAENDRVSSEGQDSASTNNANFATPTDGGRGRMQMFLWTGPAPDRDGTADAEIIIHEVTHGTSNRLHGNASGLATNMSRGMGEGWGDFYAHTLLSEPGDPVDGVYTLSGYSTYLSSPGFTGNYYYGIRRFPKSIISSGGGPSNGPHNPLTFADVDSTQFDVSDGAFGPGEFGSPTVDQVHNLGEIWSSALWELRGRMVTRLGHTMGTKRVLQAVTDGMKLSPINPTFLQGRDAIIAAALAQSLAPDASADAADVREGFRRRGMGYSASIQDPGTGSNNTRVTESFQFQNVEMTDPFNVSDSTGDNDGYPEPGESVLLHVAVTNPTGSTVSSVTASVVGGGTANYGSLAAGQTATRQISYLVPPAQTCGAVQTVTINVASDAGSQTPEVRSIQLGVPVFTGTTVSFDGVTAPALPSGWTSSNSGGQGPWTTAVSPQPHAGINMAVVNGSSTVGESSLMSPELRVTSASASVTFQRNNLFEVGSWDGMVFEISLDGGAWTDLAAAGGSFTSGGYNGTIRAGTSNPLTGRAGWVLSTAGFYEVSTATLPASANGHLARLRWRVGSDGSIASDPARIDTISLNGAAFASRYECASPTAASVSIAGRVITADGRSIPRAYVRLTDSEGHSYSAVSNAFGYFRFEPVEAGKTYVVTASAKGLTFRSTAIMVVDNVASLTIVGDRNQF
ncbi:MAG: M36 family metallopeptidase, partial [Pyrinomonadaceae bacterium]